MESQTINFDKYLSLFKDKKVKQVLKFYALSQEAKIKSVWAPHLTPFIGKDKVTEFCNEFNKESLLIYQKDIIVPIYFLLYTNKTYSFILRTPTFYFLLKWLFDLDKIYKLEKKKIYYITLEELYYILLIKNSSFISIDKKIILINLIKILKYFGIKIIL